MLIIIFVLILVAIFGGGFAFGRPNTSYSPVSTPHIPELHVKKVSFNSEVAARNYDNETGEITDAILSLNE